MRLWPWALVTALALTGCAGTRAIPTTPAPEVRAALPAALRGRSIAITLDASAAAIQGGHHEGLLQVPQPWIFGLKPEQKQLLYDHAAQVAALGFAAEIQRQGLAVQTGSPAFTLAGTVRSVTLNTYGHGTVEGFGSAGDYWDARVDFAGLRLVETRTGRVLWQGDQAGYAKLSPCPAHLDWTMLTLVEKSLRGHVLLAGGVKNADDYLHNFEGSYTLDDKAGTPIERAARVAAAEWLTKVPWE